MDIGFIAEHTVKPQFVAGQNYEGTIEAIEDKESGFTARIGFEALSTPAFWHFNVAPITDKALEGLDAEEQRKKVTTKRIADDELKGVIDQLEEPVTDSQELVGKKILVRLTSQPDSSLPSCGLPIASKKGNKLAI